MNNARAGLPEANSVLRTTKKGISVTIPSRSDDRGFNDAVDDDTHAVHCTRQTRRNDTRYQSVEELTLAVAVARKS